jgi:hypothetical protein
MIFRQDAGGLLMTEHTRTLENFRFVFQPNLLWPDLPWRLRFFSALLGPVPPAGAWQIQVEVQTADVMAGAGGAAPAGPAPEGT